MLLRFVFALLVVNIVMLTSTAQIRLQIVSAGNNEPVPYATVQVQSFDYSSVTNDSGFAYLPQKAMNYTVTVSCIGYKSLAFKITDAISRVFLEPMPVLLNELHIAMPNAEDLLFASIRKAYSNYMPNQIANLFYRTTVKDKGGQYIGVFEAQGKRYEPDFDNKQVLESRVPHVAIQFHVMRSAGFEQVPAALISGPAASDFLHRYALPHFWKNYSIKHRIINDQATGNALMQVELLPQKNIRVINLLDKKLMQTHAFFNARRTYYIQIADTSLVAIEIQNLKPQAMWGPMKNFTQNSFRAYYRMGNAGGRQVLQYMIYEYERYENKTGIPYKVIDEAYLTNHSEVQQSPSEVAAALSLSIAGNRPFLKFSYKNPQNLSWPSETRRMGIPNEYWREEKTAWKSSLFPATDYQKILADLKGDPNIDHFR
jgi:hypothetical protein